MTLYGSLFITWAAASILAFPRFWDFSKSGLSLLFGSHIWVEIMPSQSLHLYKKSISGRDVVAVLLFLLLRLSWLFLAIWFSIWLLGLYYWFIYVTCTYTHTNTPSETEACRLALNLEVNFGEIYVYNMESSFPQTWCLSPLFKVFLYVCYWSFIITLTVNPLPLFVRFVPRHTGFWGRGAL